MEEREKMGLTGALLRLSIGYTGDDAVMTDRFLASYRKVFGA